MSERAIQNGYLIAAQSDIEALRLRVKKLESLVRAADSFIENTQSCLASLRKGILEGWELSLLERHEREYLTQRAAVGEIGEE